MIDIFKNLIFFLLKEFYYSGEYKAEILLYDTS